ncbi:MAG: hypothetical protein L3J93_00920 [Thermoplasmata archaeon]|nr:hypothetical protein [Thermoplasmata archaeon]
MTATEFGNLVTRLMEAMGQSMAAVREVPEGLLLRTSDGFLWAFVENPSEVSLAFVQRLQLEVGGEGGRLVVLTPGRLPLQLSSEVGSRGGTVVESARFRELAGGLGLGPLLGEEPKAAKERRAGRLLPTAQQLDDVMARARTWAEWGVPALALRFYRQASTMKPEFLPARNGIAEALLGLGLSQEATKTFDEILGVDPSNLDARIGKATVLGRGGRTDEEIHAFRALLAEDPSRMAVRAHLVAALLETQAWGEARTEIESMLEASPDNPRLRYLHSATLERTGEATAGVRERERARTLGLPYESEKILASQLGLEAPTPPAAPAPMVEVMAPTLAEVVGHLPRADLAKRSTPSGRRRGSPVQLPPPARRKAPASRKPKKRRAR